MHFERLIIETGSRTFRLELPHGMTVIAGAGTLEREGLVDELLGALGRGRPGVHAELRDDAGVRYTVFRPPGGRPCVVDVDAAVDVSHRFTCYDDVIDPLGRAGIGPREARRLLRLDQSDLAASTHEDQLIRALAQVEQGRLWELAERVVERQRDLQQAADEGGATVTDAAVMEEIDRRHAEFEAAEARLEEVRRASFLIGGTAGVVLLPAAAIAGPVAALALGVTALGGAGTSILQWRKVVAARRAEDQALAAAGADSYLSYQVHRANALSGDAAHRRRVIVAADALRSAVASWKVLVGEDIPVDWALERQGDVRAAARRLRSAGVARNPMAVALTAGEATAAELLEALDARLATARTAGPGRESAPLLIDDAFAALPPDAKSILLERLMEASRTQQVVYLTEDPDVAEWARLEAMNGGVGIVEPTRGPDGSGKRSPGPRYVAA